jgi:adenosylcobinamide-GDP ribazoletransferase
LTSITISRRFFVEFKELTASLAYFPAVGLVIGGLLSGFDRLVTMFWQADIRAVLDVIFLIILTRGLHLDGLSDTMDALGSNAPAEKALMIMKDSRIGAFGAMALVMCLLLKVKGIEAISGKGLWQAMILTTCLSRWGLNVLASISSYARKEGGLGEAFVGRATLFTLPWAGLTAGIASFVLFEWQGILLFAGVSVFSWLTAIFFRRRLGGVTGDVLGAHLEWTEAGIFCIFSSMI